MVEIKKLDANREAYIGIIDEDLLKQGIVGEQPSVGFGAIRHEGSTDEELKRKGLRRVLTADGEPPIRIYGQEIVEPAI